MVFERPALACPHPREATVRATSAARTPVDESLSITCSSSPRRSPTAHGTAPTTATGANVFAGESGPRRWTGLRAPCGPLFPVKAPSDPAILSDPVCLIHVGQVVDLSSGCCAPQGAGDASARQRAVLPRPAPGPCAFALGLAVQRQSRRAPA